MWKLVIEDDEGKRTVVPLTRDAYTVGRKEGNTIRLTERNVSRDHCRIQKGTGTAEGGGSYLLEDLQSYNGVYVNGLRVAQTQELAHGDLIQIGDYRVVLQDDNVADAPATAVLESDLKATAPGHSGARAAIAAAQLLERPNRFVMLAGPTPGAEFPLDSERMTVGRAEEADISVNHNSVSRIHCEVHALGDGRFEIVDKGSSNGVRVNAAELRRGIIEAGDVIELGDVKFKFVGAGQIFRPGATDSQQLSTIGDRTATSLVSRRRAPSLLPYVVFGAVVTAGAIAAWALTRPRTDGPPPAPVTSARPEPESTEMQILEEARKLCAAGDCDTAFEKVTHEIPEGSSARETDAFRAVATRWAEGMLERADSEPDLDKRRALFTRLEKTPAVPEGLRKKAADRRLALEEFQRTAPPPEAVLGDGSAEASPTSATPSPNTTPVTSVTPVVSTPEDLPRAVDAATTHRPPVVTTTPRDPTRDPGTGHDAPRDAGKAAPLSDMEKVRQLMLQGPGSYPAARTILEPKVFGGRASAEEIGALKAICKGQGDKACVDHCKSLLERSP